MKHLQDKIYQKIDLSISFIEKIFNPVTNFVSPTKYMSKLSNDGLRIKKQKDKNSY
jgi:hypothetical protein